MVAKAMSSGYPMGAVVGRARSWRRNRSVHLQFVLERQHRPGRVADHHPRAPNGATRKTVSAPSANDYAPRARLRGHCRGRMTEAPGQLHSRPTLHLDLPDSRCGQRIQYALHSGDGAPWRPLPDVVRATLATETTSPTRPRPRTKPAVIRSGLEHDSERTHCCSATSSASQFSEGALRKLKEQAMTSSLPRTARFRSSRRTGLPTPRPLGGRGPNSALPPFQLADGSGPRSNRPRCGSVMRTACCTCISTAPIGRHRARAPSDEPIYDEEALSSSSDKESADRSTVSQFEVSPSSVLLDTTINWPTGLRADMQAVSPGTARGSCGTPCGTMRRSAGGRGSRCR
ncbi:MAG: hypothetical protein R3A10_04620 [Caldilineaceae bacterium]